MDDVTEQLEVLRRIAERGRSLVLRNLDTVYLDVFQHLIDEIHRTRKVYENK